MVSLVVASGLLSRHSPGVGPAISAVYKADALYCSVEPYPMDAPTFILSHAYNAYRRVLHLYGHVPAARAGLARCLLHLGRYREAAEQYKLAGSGFSSGVREASRLDRIATALGRRVGQKKVMRVVPIPGSSLVAAIIAKPYTLVGWQGHGCVDVELVIARLQARGRVAVIERKSLSDRSLNSMRYSGQDMGSADLYLMRRDAKSRTCCAVLYQNFPAADCSPCLMSILPVSGSGFGKIKVFGSVGQAEVDPPNATHGMLLVADPVYKVWWPDVYEWRENRFVLANADHPEKYWPAGYALPDSERDQYYPWWMTLASIYDIQRRFDLGLKAWRRAEISCAITLRKSHRPNSSLGDPELYGKTRENLREIRERIRWIEKKQYSHLLLYRPYDFDIQVPPYRLGNAHVSG